MAPSLPLILPPELTFEMVLWVPLALLPAPLINSMLSPWLLARWFYRWNSKEVVMNKFHAVRRRLAPCLDQLQQLNDLENKIESAMDLPELIEAWGQLVDMDPASKPRCMTDDRTIQLDEGSVRSEFTISELEDNCFLLTWNCRKVDAKASNRFHAAPCLAYKLWIDDGSAKPRLIGEKKLPDAIRSRVINTALEWSGLELETLKSISVGIGTSCKIPAKAILAGANVRKGVPETVERAMDPKKDPHEFDVNVQVAASGAPCIDFLLEMELYGMKDRKKEEIKFRLKWPLRTNC